MIRVNHKEQQSPQPSVVQDVFHIFLGPDMSVICYLAEITSAWVGGSTGISGDGEAADASQIAELVEKWVGG